MGLDMYLHAEEYVSGRQRGAPEQQERYRTVLGALGVKPEMITDGSPHFTVAYTVAYWRKANAIHAWFVRTVQNDVDECQKSYVSPEQLTQLRDLAAKALAAYDAGEPHVAGTLLPPQGGFFFGSTDVDKCYREDLELTVNQLDRVLTDWVDRPVDFYYQASW